MKEENIVALEILRSSILDKKRETLKLRTKTNEEKKRKQERLDVLEELEFQVLEKLRKILY